MDDYGHPNQKDYPGQRIMVVAIGDYGYVASILHEFVNGTLIEEATNR